MRVYKTARLAIGMASYNCIPISVIFIGSYYGYRDAMLERVKEL